MPPNLHGTDIILTNYMIGNDPSFFIFVSDEFRKIKDAEVKGLLEVSTGITKETVSGKGDNNTFSIQKDEHFVVYPSGSLHGKNLGWNGNNRSTSTTHNISSGNGAHKDDKVEGLDLENATMVEESAETTRRPTATAKPRVNPKKSAVELIPLPNLEFAVEWNQRGGFLEALGTLRLVRVKIGNLAKVCRNSELSQPKNLLETPGCDSISKEEFSIV